MITFCCKSPFGKYTEVFMLHEFQVNTYIKASGVCIGFTIIVVHICCGDSWFNTNTLRSLRMNKRAY